MTLVSHLTGLLEEQVYQDLEEFSKTKYDYKRVLELLSKKYGNHQLIISNHMTKCLKLLKLKYHCPVNELRKLFDHISSHLRSPIISEIRTEHYGTLLIFIELEKLPDEIV